MSDGTKREIKPEERAYSLSRVQVAFWTMLVVYAYLYIWFLTGEYNATIPASVLGLMGISLATFGTAAAVDKINVQTNKEKLEKEKKKLEEVIRKIAAAPSGTPADLTLEEKRDGLKEQIKDLTARTRVCKTEQFVSDITTSAGGASLHRLQFAVWTLALAVVFVITVWKTLAMPDFDATLLGLMGVSSGAYAGLKVLENKGAEVPEDEG